MAKIIDIDYNKIASDPDKEKVIYGNKAVIMKMFSLSKPTLDKWLVEMRESEFKDGVLNPTYKIVMIHIDRFIEFCKWKDENRFKVR